MAWGFLLIGALALLLSGIVHSQTPSDSNAPEMRFNRILMLPVYDMRAVYGENFSMQGPLSGIVFSIDQVDPQAVDFVRKTITAVLEPKGSFHLVTAAAQDVESMAGLQPVAGSRDARIALIQKAAERKGADAVLCTYIYAFRNRIGTAYGVESPTMVSFEMNLVSAATGRVVWRRDFTETQTTLNENLMQLGKFLQRKGRWVTAEEMAAKAIEDLLASLP
ncbi:MAG: hypothetical protein HZB87_01330 [Desulfatitalea sp.]|nr:hypothetical protein [Desulfatitalea sp.]MBI5894702.1 hypothetical protein [Desulfobacterales bacterium]